jgi:hypothetical protein
MSDEQRERHPARDRADDPREGGTPSDIGGSGGTAPVDPDVGERRAAPMPGPSRAGADRTMFPNDPVAGGPPGSGGTGASGGYGADSGWGSSGGSPDGDEGDPASGGTQTEWLRSTDEATPEPSESDEAEDH